MHLVLSVGPQSKGFPNTRVREILRGSLYNVWDNLWHKTFGSCVRDLMGNITLMWYDCRAGAGKPKVTATDKLSLHLSAQIGRDKWVLI